MTTQEAATMAVLQFPYLTAINALPKGLLYPHQSDGVSFLISKGRAILGDDTGSRRHPRRSAFHQKQQLENITLPQGRLEQ
jgi:hypothetical protein